MKQLHKLTFLVLVITSFLFFQSCAKENDQDDSNPEFIADNNTFKAFMSGR